MHLLNEDSPIDFIDDGMITEFNDLHPANAFLLIFITDDGIDTSFNDKQLKKVDSLIETTLDGSDILVNSLHSLNKLGSISIPGSVSK